MNGSILTVCAESKDEVMQMLKNDIYTKSGVWNVEDAKIYDVSRAILSKFFMLSSQNLDRESSVRRYKNMVC